MKKTMERPNWLSNLNPDEKLEVEPFTKTKEEILGTKQTEIWHIAESRNWKDSTKAELSMPFSFRMRKDLEELLKNHTKGSKNQVINDILEAGFKFIEEQHKNNRNL